MRKSTLNLPDGDHNAGTVYRPDSTGGSVPVLVVCFGGVSDRQPYALTRELCTSLTASGAAVVTFDFYGWGETSGDPDEWTYGRWARNLGDVCHFIASREWSDASRIAALGISAGSTAVLRCAIETTHLAAAICVATFLGHFVSMPAGPAKQLVDNLDTLLAGGRVEARGRGAVVYHFGLGHFLDAVGGAPIYRLDEVRCPVMFLQGGADNVFRRADAWLGHELLRERGLPSRYLEIEAGDHTLGNVAREAADAVRTWLGEVGILR